MKIIMSVLLAVTMSLLLSVGWAWRCPSDGDNGAATKEGYCIVQQQGGQNIKIKECSQGTYKPSCDFKCNIYKVTKNIIFLNLWKNAASARLAGSVSFSYLLLLNYIKKASNNDSALREIFGGPGRT